MDVEESRREHEEDGRPNSRRVDKRDPEFSCSVALLPLPSLRK